MCGSGSTVCLECFNVDQLAPPIPTALQEQGSALEWVRVFLNRVLGVRHSAWLWGCGLGCWAFHRFGRHMSGVLCETRYPS